MNTSKQSISRGSFKSFPAYGKKLDQLRRKGLIPVQRVIVSTDWELGAAYPRIVITQEQPVASLRFEYLAGLHVQIAHFDHDESILSELTTEILAVQPASLAAFNMDAVKRGEPAFKMIFSQSIMGAAA